MIIYCWIDTNRITFNPIGVVKRFKFGENPQRTIPSQSEKEGVTSMFSNKLEFKGAVIGTLLGDSSIVKYPKCNVHHLQITHCMEQVEYMLEKKKILEHLTEVRLYQDQPNGKDGKYRCCRLVTRSHPFYDSLRDHFYYRGRKTVDEHVLKCITPLGLALLYMDDGTLSPQGNFGVPMIATNNFNKVENEIIARMLQKRFGLQWRLNSTTSNYKGVKKNIFNLRLRLSDRDKFFDLIKEFVPECMKYKISDIKDKDPKARISVICNVCHEIINKWPQQISEEEKYTCGPCLHNLMRNNKGTQKEISEDVL